MLGELLRYSILVLKLEPEPFGTSLLPVIRIRLDYTYNFKDCFLSISNYKNSSYYLSSIHKSELINCRVLCQFFLIMKSSNLFTGISAYSCAEEIKSISSPNVIVGVKRCTNICIVLYDI